MSGQKVHFGDEIVLRTEEVLGSEWHSCSVLFLTILFSFLFKICYKDRTSVAVVVFVVTFVWVGDRWWPFSVSSFLFTWVGVVKDDDCSVSSLLMTHRLKQEKKGFINLSSLWVVFVLSIFTVPFFFLYTPVIPCWIKKTGKMIVCITEHSLQRKWVHDGVRPFWPVGRRTPEWRTGGRLVWVSSSFRVLFWTRLVLTLVVTISHY